MAGFNILLAPGLADRSVHKYLLLALRLAHGPARRAPSQRLLTGRFLPSNPSNRFYFAWDFRSCSCWHYLCHVPIWNNSGVIK